MMEEQNNWIEQLNIMQSNIMSLFQGVIKERNNFKEGNDFLTTSLKQMIGRIDYLERQNEMLQKRNTNLRNIFGVGLKTFKKLDLSCANSIKDNKLSLELLQKLFLESNDKLEVTQEASDKSQFPSGVEERNAEFGTNKTVMHEGKIKVKKFGLENSKPLTLVKSESEAETDERGQQVDFHRSEEILRNIVRNESHNTNDVNRRLNQMDVSNCEHVATSSCKPSEPSPQKSGCVKGSPVFKDVRKHDATRSEENKSLKSTSMKLINEKFVEKSVQLLISPWKSQQVDGSSACKEQFTPKHGKSDSKFSSPNRSPRAALRKSNSKEGETSSSGGKKLMQTFLNVDCFKQKSPVATKHCRNGEFGNLSKRSRLDNVDDDDIILDSPKRGNQVTEDCKEEKKENENESRFLDETFISSPAVRQFNSVHNHLAEEIMRDRLTCNRPREKSPEYDSVPFVYKREAIRKKEERMKLPGHPCVECDKYYKNALGDIDPNDFEKILNKCSRHRDKNPPSLDDTPPGYWKPYLTCSNGFSPNKDDAR